MACSLIERGKLERGEKVLQRIRGIKGKVANPFAFAIKCCRLSQVCLAGASGFCSSPIVM
jgi:hypothetical protein